VVRFEAAPDQTGLVCCFPFSKNDGFTVFKFHQKLSQSIITGVDHFQNRRMTEELQLHLGALPQIPVPSFSAVQLQACGRPSYSQGCYKSMSTKKMTELAFSKVNRAQARSMANVKNAVYDKAITFGNFLHYMIIPLEKADPQRLHEQFREDHGLYRAALERCQKPEDFQQGLSYEEIAFSLGVAIGTVKSRLTRARQTLRLEPARSEGPMKAFTCPSARRQLHAFHDQELGVSDQIAMGAHLEWCRECADLFAELRVVRAALRATAPGRDVLSQDEIAAFNAAVVNRAKAEADASLFARVRELFDDMHLVYVGMGCHGGGRGVVSSSCWA